MPGQNKLMPGHFPGSDYASVYTHANSFFSIIIKVMIPIITMARMQGRVETTGEKTWQPTSYIHTFICEDFKCFVKCMCTVL